MDEGSWEPFLLEGTSTFFLSFAKCMEQRCSQLKCCCWDLRTLIIIIIIITLLVVCLGFFLLSPLSEAVCQRTSVIISPSYIFFFLGCLFLVFFFFPAELMLHCCISQLLFVGFREAVCEVSTSL